MIAAMATNVIVAVGLNIVEMTMEEKMALCDPAHLICMARQSHDALIEIVKKRLEVIRSAN